MRSIARLSALYHRLFSIREIEENRILQWLFGGLLFYFFVTFQQWVGSTAITIERAASAVCWPYFQECGSLYFLSGLPDGYTHTAFYMVLFAAMLLIVWCMWRSKWASAHALLLLLFLWKAFVGYVLSYSILGMYDVYHLVLTASLLFLPYKEYFTKLIFIVLYFVAATIKFFPAWTLGTYFSSLQAGLPLFPDAVIPLATNFVIFEQTIGCWFLLARNYIVQRTALVLFVLFHVYSGVFVLYNYPAATLPALLILFGPMYRYQRPPLSWRSLAGWVVIAAIFVSQIPSLHDIEKVRITTANNRYGLWMFDSNHQCVMSVKYVYPSGVRPENAPFEAPRGASCNTRECTVKRDIYQEDSAWVREERVESALSWQRCDPYQHWRALKNQCSDYERIDIVFDHSINGGPFFRIIDERDVCALGYNAFGENAWIKGPPEAPAVGLPVKNIYRY